MMERPHILETFGTWVTFLFQALPRKLHRFWNTYSKVITEGVFSWLALSRQWIVLLLRVLQPKEILLAIDDTWVTRSFKEAPAVASHHNHAKKPNRPSFLRGQLSVLVALICITPSKTAAVPSLQRLIPKRGNRSKLQAGLLLTRLSTRWVGRTRPVHLFLDTCGLSVIGQVRRDTVCYSPFQRTETPRSGRPAKYGPQYTFSWVEHALTLHEGHLQAYGQNQRCQFYIPSPPGYASSGEGYAAWCGAVCSRRKAPGPPGVCSSPPIRSFPQSVSSSSTPCAGG